MSRIFVPICTLLLNTLYMNLYFNALIKRSLKFYVIFTALTLRHFFWNKILKKLRTLRNWFIPLNTDILSLLKNIYRTWTMLHSFFHFKCKLISTEPPNGSVINHKCQGQFAFMLLNKLTRWVWFRWLPKRRIINQFEAVHGQSLVQDKLPQSQC